MIELKKWSRLALKSAGHKILDALDRTTERGGETADTPSPLKSSPQKETETFSFGDARKPAQIFGRQSCSWSGRAMILLERAQIETSYLDLAHPGSGPLREELRMETGQMTVPYIYLRGKFVGGFNELDEIYRLGQLDYFVLTAEEKKRHPNHGKIEIASRQSLTDD